MTVVREDADGLYVKAGGYIARPGAVRGYSHAYRMDDGGLKAGDTVKARHSAGTELTIVTLPDGSKTRWHHKGYWRDQGLCDPPEDATWDSKGLLVRR